jgi:hypothetical protein
MNSAISPDGSTIAVATATQVNANSKVVFMYRRLANSGSRYQLVDTVPMGDMIEDPWTGASDYYNALDANIAVNPNGNLLASVENGVLMLYQVRSRITGSGSSAKTQLDWRRRCQIQPPPNFRFRGSEWGGARETKGDKEQAARASGGGCKGRQHSMQQAAISSTCNLPAMVEDWGQQAHCNSFIRQPKMQH